MIRAVVDFSLNKRLFILALALLLFVGGFIAFRNLPIEAYPDVANNYAWVITQWPGRAAEELEQLVTIPVENEMNGVPYLTNLRSVSVAGLSVVILTFNDKSDNAWNRQ
jgi:heavy metal efflux system protein